MIKTKKNTLSNWPKNITVDKRIVKILSESTYDNFPTSLKEILTNSYDADASEVNIEIDLEKETIIISDNGKGMSEKEFDLFTRIAGIKREKEGGQTASGRFILGKFGVGFLSIFPFFKTYSIESTKRGSEEILKAEVPAYRYFSSGQLLDVSEIPIQGNVKFDKSVMNTSYTKITLKGFTLIAKAFFFPDKINEPRKHSIQNFSSIEKLKWRLEEDLPIRYRDERFNILVKKYSPNLHFNVFLNGEQLFRNVYADQILEINGSERSFNRVYGDESLTIDENGTVIIGKIKFQYFILSDKKAVRPYEARGLKLRNINAGVGFREAFGLGTELKGARSRLQQLSGEILVIDGLNDSISVSRDKFYYDPDYEKLQEFFVGRLSLHSTNLENEAAYLREANDNKIKNIKYIQEEDVIPKEVIPVEKLPLPSRSLDLFADSVPTFYKSSSKSSNIQNKKSIDSLPKIEKTISIGDSNYKVEIGKWDYGQDIFPACKINGKKIIINKLYPLFSSVKYNDVFVKMHLLLLKNYIDKYISMEEYKKMSTDMILFFNEYL